jgi:hypothetical protein
VAAEWVAKDEWVRSLESEPPLKVAAPWAEINGHRLLVVTHTEDPSFPATLLLVGHDPYDNPDDWIYGATLLASNTWFSESGGAPISWGGGSSLSLVAPGIYWHRSWGDVDQSSTVKLGGQDSHVVEVARWIQDSELDVQAALMLEAFDPLEQLLPDERQRCEEQLDELHDTLVVELQEPDLGALRAALLTTSREYRTAKIAFESPNSSTGRRMREDLEEAATSGIPSTFFVGSWLYGGS